MINNNWILGKVRCMVGIFFDKEDGSFLIEWWREAKRRKEGVN
jgi:hypothetical protein